MRKENKTTAVSEMNLELPKLSAHSKKRASQRGIRNPWIAIVMAEGKVIYKQGFKFFYMTDKELRFHEPVMQNRLKNLIVVVAIDDNTVVTCYKNKGAVGQIKRKSKRLLN